MDDNFRVDCSPETIEARLLTTGLQSKEGKMKS